MLQQTLAIRVLCDWPWRFCLIAAILASASELYAADRTTLLVPLAHDAMPAPAPLGLYADQAFGDLASEGWKAYTRLWQAHYQDPADESIRRFLGLPLKNSFEATVRRGRSAPRWLNWRPGAYDQVDTPHFVIYSQAEQAASKHVAEDLERCYWAWTQMFFPLWEASAQVSAAMGSLSDQTPVIEYLKARTDRITIRRKLRVVLFRDAHEYQQMLGRDNPGIERSTGFYSDERETAFLYASADDDAATRRHEMVHQLFREATRSGLGRDMPGEDTGFWLIEGIAGYFESLVVDERIATVGGWDASRLQFARYRILVAGDIMSMDEVQVDGRLAAQQRPDIARWYTHGIAQTHRLLDGGHVADRRWIYQELARRYKIRAELPVVELGESGARSMQNFLSLDDAHLAANPPRRPPDDLFLAGCTISEAGLEHIPPSASLRWLDLAGLPVGNDAVRRLAPAPQLIEQLRLEATRVDPRLIDWLAKAVSLRELDLSWTLMDDSSIDVIQAAGDLATLWMTGTQLTDASIAEIAKMPNLSSVDLQRTPVTESGISRLRAARPNLEINPLELRAPQ